MLIPDDARRSLWAIRDGLSDQAYADAIWVRRDVEHGPVRRPRWRWPLVVNRYEPPKPLNFSELKAILRKVTP